MQENFKIPKHVKEMLEEAREIRRRYADWSFINKQPEPIKTALIYYIEIGDMRIAAKLAGLSLEEFLEIAHQASIPTVS